MLEPVACPTRVVILQHPRERRVPIGTGWMTHLALPNSEVRRGVRFAADAALVDHAALLYPGTGALPASALRALRPRTLVVLDGTWGETAKLYARNPFLHGVPRIGFEPPAPSGYRIRREPAAHCWSTIEAVAHVLGILADDPQRFAPLLAPFRHLVATQLAYGARGSSV
jgi:DTW domain-containing protein